MAVRWADVVRWSVVWVEFGTPKKDIQDRLDSVDIENKYISGVNSNNEFSYRHMAIIISKNIHDSNVTVVPLTTAKDGDDKSDSKIVIPFSKYKSFLQNDTSILIDHITTIEKKARIKKLALKWIPLLHHKYID